MLALTFCVHTAAALFLGLTGGVLALWLRDRRAFGALAIGSLAGALLVAVHLRAGCSPAEALLFSQGDYLRTAARAGSLSHWPSLLALAGVPALAAAALGARELVRRHTAASVLAAVVCLLYLNELWLAPFGARTTLDLQRGLTVLAFPVAAAAGVALSLAAALARGWDRRLRDLGGGLHVLGGARLLHGARPSTSTRSASSRSTAAPSAGASPG